MKTTVIVDGYNVIRRHPAWGRVFHADKAASRRALTTHCRRWKDGRRDVGDVIVVFDGDSSVWGGSGMQSGVRVEFTETGMSADDRIAGIVRGGGREGHFLVVTDDAELVWRVRAEGGQVMAVTEFCESAGLRPKARTPAGPRGDDKFLSLAQRQQIDADLRRHFGLD